MTGLYVIDKGDSVAYARDDLDFVVTDDSYIDFDREGQFVPFEFGQDSYQTGSIKTPEIAVVVCPRERLTTGRRTHRSPTLRANSRSSDCQLGGA